MRSESRSDRLETLAAIREMERDGAAMRVEIERVRREAADLEVRERAGWLLTQLADASR